MPRIEGTRQINCQVTEEDLEDIKVMANRRGQTMSEFIRRTLREEMAREAVKTVTW